LGGLDARLCDTIEETLARVGFGARTTGHHLKGNGPNNICNRGKRRVGAQLELPQTLRDTCVARPLLLHKLGAAVHRAIRLYVFDGG
jgi:phage replication-related protein YjqB (UPF0714/DUF867 family)